MTKERLQYLLNRYLDNTATEEEHREYDSWYKSASGSGKDLFEREDSAEAEAYKQQLLGSIMRHIEVAENKDRKGGLYTLLARCAVAASVIVLVTISFFLLNHNEKPSTITARKEEKKNAGPKADTLRIENYTAGTRKISLNDGTSVELFANSVLSYEPSYGNTERRVYLKGKGFFNVAKDPARPFIVFSEGITTTALGTSFTVTAYPGKNVIAVALHTGKVVVHQVMQPAYSKMEDVYLLPGQRFDYTVSSGIAVVQKDKTATAGNSEKTPVVAAAARKGFSTVFEQAPLAAVFREIEKGYAVHLQWNNSELANMLFSGKVRETDTLLQVLQRIAALHDLEITEKNKGYRIRKKH